jgi:hypothetical protein
MGREVNIDAILALEKQIEDGEGDIIQLKRVRNSLLNVYTRMPPEILGEVFIWSVFREEDHSLNTVSHFRGVRKGSYNFLLVCHHWFEVASSTPELWNFWGNTLTEWKSQHSHPGVAPLDLVLCRHPIDHDALVDGPLRDALRSRATQDTIRYIHFGGLNADVLQSIVSSLTPDGEDVRYSSIESIDFRPLWGFALDVSNFFARHSFPKLRSLFLLGTFRVPSWDRLIPHTTHLTTLSLAISRPSPVRPPTASQLLSILVSNPNLQELLMNRYVIPDDDGSTFQVPMRHLKKLELTGELRSVFRLLNRLTFPGTLDSLLLAAFDSTVENVLQISGPYLQGYFQHHRPQDRLGIDAHSVGDRFSIRVKTTDKSCLRTSSRKEWLPFVEFRMIPEETIPPDVLDNLCLDLIAFTPRERVSWLRLRTKFPVNRMEDLLVAMPNIDTLRLSKVALSKGFLQPNPDGPHANTKLLPSLRYLDLHNVTLTDGDWGHLTAYLAHQTSNSQVISLQASGRSYMGPEVMSEIEGLVEEFSYRGRPKAKGRHSEDEGGEDSEEDEDGGD